MTDKANLIAVRGLTKFFPVGGGILSQSRQHVRAVDHVDFEIARQETFGLVGESGCGKTTIGRLLLRLMEPTSGEMHFAGADLMALKPKDLRAWRRRAQIVFQDPYASLNPRMRVADIIGFSLYVHGLGAPDRDSEIRRLLELVGLGSELGRRFPHQLSGGQSQRVGIARALSVDPEFVVLDEPVSALDVSIQAQILNLLKDLQDSLGLTYLFISHDLGVVEHMSGRVAVMHLGKIVEVAVSGDLYRMPAHPYTQALLDAIPLPTAEPRPPRASAVGELPSAIDPPSGCRYRTRCPLAASICAEIEPPLDEIRPGHFVACHRVAESLQKRARVV